MNKPAPGSIYSTVMLARIILAVLLLSSHVATLRAAHPTDFAQRLQQTGPYEADGCCPLCTPDLDNTQPTGCGCGCGELDTDKQLPYAPRDHATMVSRIVGFTAFEQELVLFSSSEPVQPQQCASVHDDASGHTNTMRFLARVGHWLN